MHSARRLRRVLLRAGSLVLCIVALSACAVALSELYQEPQQVALKPELALEPKAIGAARALVLEVVDRRPKNILGYRGGVDPTTAPIYPQPSVAEAVRNSVTAALARYDFVVHSPSSPASIRIRVVIERLEYATNHEYWPTSMTTSGAAKLICRNGGKYYSNRYTAEYREGLKWPPGEAAIANSVNETLSQMLSRLLSDPGLLEVLAKDEETDASSGVRHGGIGLARCLSAELSCLPPRSTCSELRYISPEPGHCAPLNLASPSLPREKRRWRANAFPAALAVYAAAPTPPARGCSSAH